LERYCFALDLVDDDARIAEYEAHHAAVWPEVRAGFIRAGIEIVELYRTGTRLFMILETDSDFSFEKKQKIDESDPKISEWEALMSTYQVPLPWASEGQRWIMMNCIFKFNK
jgi:L-rhamnose mutarotase